MRISKHAALFFGLCAFSLAPSALNGGEALQMKVSPAIQRAPAMLTVRVTVESSEDNRLLQVIAESPTGPERGPRATVPVSPARPGG